MERNKIKKEIISLIEQIGFEYHAALNRNALVFRKEVRAMCEANRCDRYGKNWSCPPACGSLEQMKERTEAFTDGILVQSFRKLEDAFDFEAMKEWEGIHKQRFDTLIRQIRMQNMDCLPLSAGSCSICHTCTYPKRPCRYPKRRYSSMEAYGLWVSQVCIESGLAYNYGENTTVYTSCVLYGQKGEKESGQ